MTGSPVLVGDTIITGVSANGAGGPTPTFRGAIVALDAQTGRSCGGPTRCRTTAAFRAATRAPRCSRRPRSTTTAGLVYGTFGQPYTEPASVTACHAAAHGGFSESCEQPGSYLKSIVAFDLKTGAPGGRTACRATIPGCGRAAASRPT